LDHDDIIYSPILFAVRCALEQSASGSRPACPTGRGRERKKERERLKIDIGEREGKREGKRVCG